MKDTKDSHYVLNALLKESKRLHHEDIMTGNFNPHEVQTFEEQSKICSQLERRANIRLSTLN